MITVPESGVLFGKYDEENFWGIEKSHMYNQMGSGIKSVEFILSHGAENIILLEAKSSCPNPNNREKSEEKRKKYEEFFKDIVDKFIDSFNILLTTVLERNKEESRGNNIKRKNNYKNVKFVFVLVVTNAEESWLPGPKAELDARLIKMRRIWGVKIAVINKKLGSAPPWNLICDD